FLMLNFVLGPAYGGLFFGGQLYRYLLPGAIVGLVLWLLLAGHRKNLDAAFRFTVGTAVSLPVLVWLDWLDLRWGFRHEGEVSLAAVFSGVIGILLLSAAVGGIAGLASPEKTLSEKESSLSYRERVQLYESAEQEAS